MKIMHSLHRVVVVKIHLETCLTRRRQNIYDLNELKESQVFTKEHNRDALKVCFFLSFSFQIIKCSSWASLVALLVKNLPAMQETLVQFLGREDPLEMGQATHSCILGFPCGSAGKESACNVGDLGSIPGLGRSPGEGKGYPLQYSCLKNSMDCILHGVAKSRT